MNATQAKLLVDLKAYIEGCFPPGESTAAALAVTGEPYVTFANTGPTAEDAINFARDAFDAYAEGKTGKVYWRVGPELEMKFQNPAAKVGSWWFYMRLLISNKPAKET